MSNAPKAKSRRLRVQVCEGDLVIVDWVDAAGQGAWVGVENSVLPLQNCRSVGWLARKNRIALSLYADASRNVNQKGITSVANRNTIPCSCVTKVTVLRKQKACD